MPADQSEGTRSQVLRWLKAEGDSVTRDEPIIEMETDKVTVEIAAPGTGVLRQILKPEQTDVEPGDVLGLIEAEGAVIANATVGGTDLGAARDAISVDGPSAQEDQDPNFGHLLSDLGKSPVEVDSSPSGQSSIASSPAAAQSNIGENSLGAAAQSHIGESSRGTSAQSNIGKNSLGATAQSNIGESLRGTSAQLNIGKNSLGAAAQSNIGESSRGTSAQSSIGKNSPGASTQSSTGKKLADVSGQPNAAASPADIPAQPTSGAPHGNTSSLSPAVRRLLAESGLEPSRVAGTGPGGRITVDDVLAQVSRGEAEQKVLTGADAPRAAAVRTGGPVETPDSGTRRVPHSPVRKRVAEHMVRSLHTAPHVTSVFEADMSAVIAHRARHRERFERSGTPLTFTAYFLSAIVDAIRAVPEANSRWTDDALEIYEAINIGVGTALGDQGLVVPVIQHVESMTLERIATDLNAIVTRAREGKLTPTDVRGGTFTISNHGVSGSVIATPIIINQPQSAILGIGKLDQRVVPAKDGGSERFAVVPKCYVTLTIDHRVMDGFQANKFLQIFVGKLESWPAS